jgi:hypothetical protein
LQQPAAKQHRQGLSPQSFQEPQLQPSADAASSTLCETVLSESSVAPDSTAIAAGRQEQQQSMSEQQQGLCQQHDLSLQHQRQEQQQQQQQQVLNSGSSSSSMMSMAPLDSAWGGDDAVRGLVYGATVRFSDSAALRLRRRAMVVWEQVSWRVYVGWLESSAKQGGV